MSASPLSIAGYWRLVRANHNFRRLLAAQIVSEIGDWFYALAIYNLLLQLTGSARMVALAVVLQVLPQTFFGPIAGAVNDRISRKRVMIAADLARMAIVLGMLLVRSASTVWFVFPLLLLETVGATFFEPARNSVIPNIVPEDSILSANTLSSTTWSFNLAIGATLGGAAAVALGRDAVFVLNALSFLASALLIARMDFHEPHAFGAPPLGVREIVDFRPIFEGFRYIASRPRLLATVFVKFGLGIMGSNNVILPLLGARVFPVSLAGIDPKRGAILGMSLLMGARGVGSLLGPFGSGGWAGQREFRLRLGILIGFFFAGLGYVTVGISSSAALAIGAVVLAHASGSTIWVFSTTLLQMYTEDRYRGRVFAAEIGLLTLTIAISSYAAGLAMDWGVPVRTVAIGTGCAMSLPFLAWAAVLTAPGARTRR